MSDMVKLSGDELLAMIGQAFVAVKDRVAALERRADEADKHRALEARIAALESKTHG